MGGQPAGEHLVSELGRLHVTRFGLLPETAKIFLCTSWGKWTIRLLGLRSTASVLPLQSLVEPVESLGIVRQDSFQEFDGRTQPVGGRSGDELGEVLVTDEFSAGSDELPPGLLLENTT